MKKQILASMCMLATIFPAFAMEKENKDKKRNIKENKIYSLTYII